MSASAVVSESGVLPDTLLEVSKSSYEIALAANVAVGHGETCIVGSRSSFTPKSGSG